MDRRKLRIIIFEHSEVQFRFLEEMAEDSNIFQIEWFWCNSFHAAIKAFGQHTFDLGIFSFESEGIPLIGALRQYKHELPCLLSTKHEDPFVHEQARLHGVGSVLTLRHLTCQKLEDQIAKVYYSHLASQDAIEQEYRLSIALKAARMVTWDWDVAKDELRYSNEPSMVLGKASYGFRHTFQTFLKYVHPDDREAVSNSIQEVLKEGENYDFEYRLHWADGRIRWAQALARVFRDAQGKAVKMTGVVMDITENKEAAAKILRMNQELEERVRQRTAELEASNKELEAFAYSVSHDLRVPLQGMYGFIEILLQSPLDDQTRRYVQRIRRSAERMSALIDDLLALSRVTRLKLVRAEVDVTSLVLRVLKDRRTSDRDRYVETHIEPTRVAQADERLVRVAIENLVGNAWKYTGHTKVPLIQFGSIPWEGQEVYFIKDNGAGFDMEKAEKLFHPFQRLHSEREFTGTGIGLATVARVIQRHGGSIWAEATVNEGATFFFTLDRPVKNQGGLYKKWRARQLEATI
jgi:signal transduction histidine kinase